ncbi:MAG: hypothetical protein VCC00_14040 [Deltaproteobacteria bacterium]
MFPELDFDKLFSTLDEVWTNVREQLDAEGVFSQATAQGVVDFARPVGPAADSPLFAPVIGVAGMLASLLLAGVAMGALGAFLAAVMALGFLLARVYGVSFEIAPFAGMAA